MRNSTKDLLNLSNSLESESDRRQKEYQKLVNYQKKQDHYDLVVMKTLDNNEINQIENQKTVSSGIKVKKAYVDLAKKLLKKKIGKGKPGLGRLFHYLVEELYTENQRKKLILDKLYLVLSLIGDDLEKALMHKSKSHRAGYKKHINLVLKGRGIFFRMFWENSLSKNDLENEFSKKDLQFINNYIFNNINDFTSAMMEYNKIQERFNEQPH
jgi:hypothetical protein